jgi:hypothetical protein
MTPLPSIEPLAAPALPGALSLARGVLRALIPANVIYGGLILALLIASLIAPATVFSALGVGQLAENGGLVTAMRAIMVFGIAAAACAHRILDPLLAIVETVRGGDPFDRANARRLNAIAWAVLVLEVLRAITALTAGSVSSAAPGLDIGWSLDLTRWITVLLLFVLARVFEHGTRLRDDLEGTV